MKTWQSILLGIFLGMGFTGIVLIIAKQPSGEPIQLAPSVTPAPVKAYITGAVQQPGVYSLPFNSRVKELVDSAGGFLIDADQAGINLAAVLIDGQKVVVPFTKMDIQAGGDKNKILSITPVANLVNINTASKEELDSLPGIGESKAEDIIKYRDQKGLYKTIEDIQNVPGIGPSIFSKIKELITIN
jgi:competence protein ComEA